MTTYNYERQADQDVQNIINPGPKKILSGWQLEVACQRLIKIDEPKSGVKGTDERLSAGRKDKQSNCSKAEMKHVVGRSPAG